MVVVRAPSKPKAGVNAGFRHATIHRRPMPRVLRSLARFAQSSVDVAVLAASYGAAFWVRFEGTIPPGLALTLAVSLPLVVCTQLAVLHRRHVHRVAWRYVGLADARRIVGAVLTATLVLLCVRAAIGADWFQRHILASLFPGFRYVSSPIGVLLADAVFASTGLTSARAIWRVLTERGEVVRRKQEVQTDPVPTILAGAGRAGALVARELQSRPDVGLEPVAFVDDDLTKLGTQIAGLPVLGSSGDIERVARHTGAKQVLISMASAPGEAVRRVMRVCETAGLPVKIVPGLFEMIGGAKALSQIRNVSLEDLLRREPVDLDMDSIGGVASGRVLLITGAGGSIGSELCRQVARFAPSSLVLVEQAENNLFFIERELREHFPTLDIVPCIADVCDAPRIGQVFARHRPQVVFHAAAHKHVPMMEANPGEAIKNNLFGTMTVAEAADRSGVSEFVLISTDKAVNPTSVMGATKRAAEIYVQALSSRSRTRFVAVRFGNVLGSTGSVVPIFQEQIRRGGPITVTHPDMKRYFMTIPEATQLVLQAATIGKSGEILILDMGAPVRLVDLAQDLITLSGLRAGIDVKVEFTGVRPGEKLFEELSTADEAADKTRHPRVFVGRIAVHSWNEIIGCIGRLRAVIDRGGDEATIRRALADVVPEFHVPSRAAPAAARESVVELAVSAAK